MPSTKLNSIEQTNVYALLQKVNPVIEGKREKKTKVFCEINKISLSTDRRVGAKSGFVYFSEGNIEWSFKFDTRVSKFKPLSGYEGSEKYLTDRALANFISEKIVENYTSIFKAQSAEKKKAKEAKKAKKVVKEQEKVEEFTSKGANLGKTYKKSGERKLSLEVEIESGKQVVLERGMLVYFNVKKEQKIGEFRHANFNVHSPKGYAVISVGGKIYERVFTKISGLVDMTEIEEEGVAE